VYLIAQQIEEGKISGREIDCLLQYFRPWQVAAIRYSGGWYEFAGGMPASCYWHGNDILDKCEIHWRPFSYWIEKVRHLPNGYFPPDVTDRLLGLINDVWIPRGYIDFYEAEVLAEYGWVKVDYSHLPKFVF